MPLSEKFSDTYGPWAVVTGASAGIGAEFARQLAAAGLSVVICARRIEKLEELSAAIKKEHTVDVRLIKADLTSEEGRQAVFDGTIDLDVGLLINNAGVDNPGPFLSRPLSEQQGLINLNVTAIATFTHVFGTRFVARNNTDATGKRRSGMVMVSSMLNSGTPSFAIYSASKAFTTALALGVLQEWADDRVDVTSVEPGPTTSEMNERQSKDYDFSLFGFSVMSSVDVVREGLEAFEKRKASVQPHEKCKK